MLKNIPAKPVYNLHKLKVDIKNYTHTSCIQVFSLTKDIVYTKVDQVLNVFVNYFKVHGSTTSIHTS